LTWFARIAGDRVEQDSEVDGEGRLRQGDHRGPRKEERGSPSSGWTPLKFS